MEKQPQNPEFRINPVLLLELISDKIGSVVLTKFGIKPAFYICKRVIIKVPKTIIFRFSKIVVSFHELSQSLKK